MKFCWELLQILFFTTLYQSYLTAKLHENTTNHHLEFHILIFKIMKICKTYPSHCFFFLMLCSGVPFFFNIFIFLQTDLNAWGCMFFLSFHWVHFFNTTNIYIPLHLKSIYHVYTNTIVEVITLTILFFIATHVYFDNTYLFYPMVT